MQGLHPNQYILEEVFQASPTEVFQHLTRIGSAYSLGCDSEIVSPLVPNTSQAAHTTFGVGYTWQEHRRHLFLRDVMECEITHCDKPVALRIVSNDGFNQLNYDFKLAELGATATTVHCTVYCYTHPTGQGQPASPSEKLAIMMRNQDRLAIRQLKGAMENGHALSVC